MLSGEEGAHLEGGRQQEPIPSFPSGASLTQWPGVSDGPRVQLHKMNVTYTVVPVWAAFGPEQQDERQDVGKVSLCGTLLSHSQARAKVRTA